MKSTTSTIRDFRLAGRNNLGCRKNFLNETLSITVIKEDERS